MNIFQLEQEYLSLMAEIEANEGELTDELIKKLEVNSSNFASKMDAYANIIAVFEGNNAIIEDEQKRLSALHKSNETSIASMKKIMITALELFGNVGKSGNRTYKTPLHSYWNVYHKPLIIEDELSVPLAYVKYTLSTNFPEDVKEKIATVLAKEPTINPHFNSDINRTELKKAVEAGEVKKEGIYIDNKASYLLIK